MDGASSLQNEDSAVQGEASLIDAVDQLITEQHTTDDLTVEPSETVEEDFQLPVNFDACEKVEASSIENLSMELLPEEGTNVRLNMQCHFIARMKRNVINT